MMGGGTAAEMPAAFGGGRSLGTGTDPEFGIDFSPWVNR
jgi:hypothetical protein